MKNTPQRPSHVPPGGLWFAPQTVETKTPAPRAIPARELTLEQLHQVSFPELVGEIQSSATDAVADRKSA